MRNFTRRNWLQLAALANAGILLPSNLFASEERNAEVRNNPIGKKLKTILVVSGWQDVNIGDIAHTPGLLHVLQKKQITPK